MEHALIFPHQLYPDRSWLAGKPAVHLLEDVLSGDDYTVNYIGAHDTSASLARFFEQLGKQNCSTAVYVFGASREPLLF